MRFALALMAAIAASGLANEAAARFYAGLGFNYTGVVEEGERQMVLRLALEGNAHA